MDGLKSKFKSLFMIIFFFSMMFGFSNNVNAISIAIEEQVFQELTRSWENINLLYDDYFHDSSDVYQELNRFHDLVPELIDMETFGQSYQGKDLMVLKITNELRNYQKAKTLGSTNSFISDSFCRRKIRLGFGSEVKEGDLMRNWKESGMEKEVSREKMTTEVFSIK